VRELALHLLDIAENSISAQARNITVSVMEDTRQDRLKLSVEDDGRGMDAEMVRRVVDPFVTTRTTRKVGLGIPLLKAAAEACQGGMKIESTPGKGTRLEVVFQRSHIDRMPLGDLPGTFLNMMIGAPQIHWVFVYTVDDNVFELDDAPIKEELDGIPLTDPDVLNFLRKTLETGINELMPAASRI